MSEPIPDPRQRLGHLLREIRVERHLTLAELGARLSFDYTTISRFERGERKVPQQYVDQLCKELQVPAHLQQELIALCQHGDLEGGLPSHTRADIGTGRRVMPNALAALLGSVVVVWLWRLGVYREWQVREPPLGYELSWGAAVGLGLALGLVVYKAAEAGRDWARAAKGHAALAGPSTLGGMAGGLLWAGARTQLAPSPSSALDEAVLWSAVYAVGFVLPFALVGLLWAPRAGGRQYRSARDLALASAATILLAGLLAFGVWVVLYSVVPDVTQPLNDILLSLCLQASLASGLALFLPSTLPAIQHASRALSSLRRGGDGPHKGETGE